MVSLQRTVALLLGRILWVVAGCAMDEAAQCIAEWGVAERCQQGFHARRLGWICLRYMLSPWRTTGGCLGQLWDFSHPQDHLPYRRSLELFVECGNQPMPHHAQVV